MNTPIYIHFTDGAEMFLDKNDKWELKEGCFIIYDEGDIRIYPRESFDEILIGKWATRNYINLDNISVYK